MTSIVLANDLNCGSGNGLVVGHGSITINLNGHTIRGNNTGAGIFNDQPTVTIENGTVDHWADADVESLGAADKITGIRATNSFNDGIYLQGVGSSATGNVSFSNGGNGIVANDRSENVTSNVVRQNVKAGIEVGPGGSGAIVQTNHAENNGTDGIQDHGVGATITGNVTYGNANDGINSQYDPTSTVANNTANFNGAYGIEASAGGKDGGGNQAKGNPNAKQCINVVWS